MLVESSRWPANLPEDLTVLNAKMDTELSKIPVLDIGMFALREVQVIYLGAQGMDAKASGKKLHLSYHTVRTHRRKAFERTPAHNIHGLTYRMMHGGWFPYEYDEEAAEGVELEPVQSLLLKGFALGKTRPQLIALGVTTKNNVGNEVKLLSAQLDTQNDQARMVSRAYEIGLFVPDVEGLELDEIPPIPMDRAEW